MTIYDGIVSTIASAMYPEMFVVVLMGHPPVIINWMLSMLCAA